MGVALLFIDGVGVGSKDPAKNPLASARHLLSQFHDGEGEPLPGGHLRAVDATFGIPGRPQSATNQTAILTGEPAPALLGRHLLGFPNAFLARLLEERSVVRRMIREGRSAAFANAYPTAYLDGLGLPRFDGSPPDPTVRLPDKLKRRFKPSATTLAMKAAGIGLRTFEDAARGEAITHDLHGERARARGMGAPLRSPREAAEIFLRLARRHDFTLFEHYLADEAGHAQDRTGADETLAAFDVFAREIVQNKPGSQHVFICSDHGNVEDLSTRSHTRHAVPVLYFGPRPDVLHNLANLADVGRTILRLLDVQA